MSDNTLESVMTGCNVTPSIQRPSCHLRVLASTLIAALGGLLFGFDTAVISGTTEALQRVFSLSSGQLGITVASALVGTIIGSFVAGKLTDRFGRRAIFLLLSILYFIGAAGSALATSWFVLLTFRLVGGLAVGGASVVSPLYIAEIAPARMRGRLVAMSQLNIVLGILLAFGSNYLIGTFPLTIDAGWRVMLGVQVIPSLLFFLLALRLCESPRWLIRNHRVNEAREVFQSLGEREVDRRIQEITESLHEDRVRQDEPFLCKRYRFPIIATIIVASFNQLSGINALMYYAPRIFKMAGAGHEAALLQAVAIGCTNLLFTIAAMFLIDRLGRKFLLLTGSVGMALALGLVAGAFSLGGTGAPYVLVGLIGFIAFFAFSQGAVIWVFISEIFPNRVRDRGQSLGCFTHWAWAAIVSGTFPLLASFSGTGSFAFFGAMMVLQFLFILFFLPETKGISLEEIQLRLGIE